MSRVLARIAAFCVVTLLLTWLWGAWGRVAYGKFLLLVAPPIYDAIGFGGARVGPLRERYINFVPFVGLMLVTPGLTLRRRGLGLAAGLGLIFVAHLALNLTELLQPGEHLPFVPSLISDTAPFLLWVILAYPALKRFVPSTLSLASTRDEEPRSPTRDGDAKPGAERVTGK